MSPRDERSGPATTKGPPAYNLNNERNPTARAYAGPPCRGRGMWAVTVLTCPLCGGMHQHRVSEVARLLAGRVFRTCPVVGRLYRLAPVTRRREARRVAD